ncbi:MAG: 3-isopropylmalate dehydratase small subunit [Candidatus Walczuchella monophlebidarum]
MKKFNRLISKAVPLEIENIDTDQIIPARFLKTTTREHFGANLFRDWRFTSNGIPIKNFIINNSSYSGEILLTGKNFGCGSSREHAAWALLDYGFRVVISSSFADIFKENTLNNGLLPIEVSEKFLTDLFQAVQINKNTLLCVDLEKQILKIGTTNKYESFDIDSYKKMCFINGSDDIDFLISLKDQIKAFEKKHSEFLS